MYQKILIKQFLIVYCCGNHQSQRPIITQGSKSLSRISNGDHKRTQQGVSAELLSYLYKLHMVHATNNYSCPNVHVLSMSAPYVHHEIAMLLTCSLTSFIQTAPACSRPMTSHYVTSYVTTVTCLFIINKKEKEIQKKRNIKSRKIDKRKKEKYQCPSTL